MKFGDDDDFFARERPLSRRRLAVSRMTLLAIALAGAFGLYFANDWWSHRSVPPPPPLARPAMPVPTHAVHQAGGQPSLREHIAQTASAKPDAATVQRQCQALEDELRWIDERNAQPHTPQEVQRLSALRKTADGVRQRLKC